MYPRVWKRNPRMRGQGNAERYVGSEEGGGNRNPWMSKLPFWVCVWVSRAPRNVLNWYSNFLKCFEYVFECSELPGTFWIDFWTPWNILTMFLSLQSLGWERAQYCLNWARSHRGVRIESRACFSASRALRKVCFWISRTMSRISAKTSLFSKLSLSMFL